MISAPAAKEREIAMPTNYKLLYEQMRKMLDMYQNEIVPQMREMLEKCVEVVRCRECKHAQYIDNNEPMYICTCPDVYGYGNRGSIHCRSTHYCGYGKRKDGAE